MSEKKSPIIVTGSSGFIGRAVCAAFVQDGYPVIGLDRFYRGNKLEGEPPRDGASASSRTTARG